MKNERAPKHSNRIIGLIEGDNPGPYIIALGGIHGNEPAGIQALEDIFSRLKNTEWPFHGHLLALRGNIAALKKKQRYIDEDMNRIWFPSIIDEIRKTPQGNLASSERREIKDVLRILDKFLPEETDQPIIFADLHSFSAEGNMFAISARKQAHLNLFDDLSVPLIFGIEKTLRGAALSYYQKQNYITFALEGGQHKDQSTVPNIIASMLSMLTEAGCLDATNHPSLARRKAYLAEYNKHIPSQVELVYQHLIEPDDQFKMRPGFKNFEPITKGQWLATDRHGKITARCDGYMLMPLYQKQGNDGFFITQEI